MSIHSNISMILSMDETIVRMTIASSDWKQVKFFACQNESLEVAIKSLYQTTQELNIDPSSQVDVFSTNEYVTELWKRFYPNMTKITKQPKYWTKRTLYK